MFRCLLAVLSLLVSFDVKAHCTSAAFDSWGIMDQSYSPGREAFLSSKNSVEPSIYVYSDAIFRRVHQMVVNADKHVYIQTWKFEPKTKPALYLADAIRKLHARRVSQRKTGTVHIWLMVNIIALQNEVNEREKFQDYLEEHGLDLPGIEIHLGFFKANLLGANHVKTVSADGKVALITGANFSSNNNGKGFYDLGFVVRGEVLTHVDYDFVQTWRSKVNRAHYPGEWRAVVPSSLSSTCRPILTTRSWVLPNLTDKIRSNSMNAAFIESVENAKKTVDIITPNLNVTPFMTALASAANRGVRVRIILSKGFIQFGQDLPTRGGNNSVSVRRIYDALQPHLGNRTCNQLQIRWYSQDGVSPIRGTNPPASHAKFMIVDDRIVYFGSANMDNQSWVNSRELALFVDDRNLGSQWRHHLFDDVFSRSINVDQCQ